MKINTDVTIGYSCKNDKAIKLTFDDKMYNTLVVGPTGSGKSGFTIKTLIKQDIENNTGIILIEPKNELSCDLFAMCKHYNRELIYFNPIHSKQSAKFNPLAGDEKDVSNILMDTFLNYIEDTISNSERINLLKTFRNALKILKCTYGEANLKDFYYLLSDQNEFGKEIIYDFMKKSTEEPSYSKSYNSFVEELEISNYFLNYYKNKSVNSIEYKIDSILEDVINNKYLKKVLILSRHEENELNFDYALSNNVVLSLSTAQGYIKHLGNFMGELLINTLVTSIFNSSYGKRNVFKSVYLDEAQLYVNNNYVNLLKSGRAYNIASVLSLQSTEILLDSKKSKHLYFDIINNARNLLIYPGLSYLDAEKYASVLNHCLSMKNIKTRFSAEDLIYRKFGQITIMTISDKDFSIPQVVNVKFIEKEIEEIIQCIVKNTFFE